MHRFFVLLLLWSTALNAQHQEFQPVIDEIVDEGRARSVVVGFYDDGEDVASITLRELSTHTSGLPRLPANMNFDNPEDAYAGYDRELLFAFLESFDPESLDKSYEYSNLGAGLLGEIAADVAGADMSNWSGFDALAGAGALTSSVDDMLTFIDNILKESAIGA